MDPPPSENTMREMLSSLDNTQLEKLWKLNTLMRLEDDQLQELRRLHAAKQLQGIIKIAKKVPHNIADLIADNLDDEPVEDYVDALETRRQMFNRINNVAVTSASKISAALFAVIMVAPVSVLESRLAQLEESSELKNQAEVDRMLAQWQSISLDGIRAFANKGGPQKGDSSASTSVASSVANSDIKSPPGSTKASPQKRQRKTSEANSSDNSPSPSMQPSPLKRSRGHGRSNSESSSMSQVAHALRPIMASQQFSIGQPSPSTHAPANVGLSVATSTSYTRSSEAVKLCKSRDDNTCCFTGMPDPHAAYIFPFGVSKNAAISRITNMLEMFWGEETKNNLSKSIRDRKITESPKNLICINRQLYTWLDDCKAALKPLEKLEEGVRVQFHWLNESKYKPNSIVTNFATFKKQTGINDGKSWGYKIAHRKSGLMLNTGQTFVLKSENADHMPSFELLELSWNLLRIAAMCGASGELDELSDDDDDEEVYSDVEVYSAIADENNYPDVRQWIEAVEGGIEMETGKDEQPGDDFEGPF
ncbi:hypothetical protein N5P37_008440 [Trichoderma harzianum]|nr:hypothetical protein N5P37_008440 [Trichoderma harzianum]